ncbi:MAG: hypothetical protein MJZ13_06485 [Bacteroidales bacterium]|nr:hypothetical protein [Bacteroidales bacterium]
MARFFQKICHKKFESYVIQRIWHRLNDDRVQFVFQQEVVRDNGIALLDLYLPQVQMSIEVNEAYHEDYEQTLRDEARNTEVMQKIGVKPMVVRCAQKIEDVHAQIETVVEEIKHRVCQLEKEHSFIAWTGDEEMKPKHYQDVGYLEARPYNGYVKTIDDAFAIFEAKAKHKGFLRVGGADIPNRKGWIVWCPNSDNGKWHNVMSEDGSVILEYPKAERGTKSSDGDMPQVDHQAAIDHLKDHKTKQQTRVTFFKEKDALGFNFYRFVGVFKLDEKKSDAAGHCIWTKISDRYDLKKGEIK